MPLITNVMGSTTVEVGQLVEALDDRAEIAAIELNVSCPNVATGLDIGADPISLAALLRAVRPLTSKVLIVKLTPNTADVAAVAQAAESEGADAVSLINTLRATALTASRRAVARWGDRRAVGSRDSHRRTCAGCRGGAPGTRSDRGHGWRQQRPGRPRPAVRGRHAGRRRYRELSRSRGR